MSGQSKSELAKSGKISSGYVRSDQCNVRSGQAMSSNDKARSDLVRFGQVMTNSGQVWSCQRLDRSTSAKDRSSLVRSGPDQV